MGRTRIFAVSQGAVGRRPAGGAGTKRTKRSPGLAIVERGGFFHLHGTVRVKGRGIRVRSSTGLPARPDNRDAAEEIRRQQEAELRDQILYGVRPSVPFAVAAEAYLTRPRRRPLNAIDVMRLQELTREFGVTSLDRIEEGAWSRFVDRRMAAPGKRPCAPATRERYIDLVMSFLKWCQARPRQWISELPAIDRNREARYRTQRRHRRVGDLRPELVQLLVEHAPPHLKGQIAIMWSTGHRVSSLLYGCRLCDYLAAEGREQITFLNTKNGRDVTASVHPWAAAVMTGYLAWRGRLHDREAPLFLTDRHLPYADNGKAAGGQNKTAWHGMVARAREALRADILGQAINLRREGRGAEARELWRAMKSDRDLLGQVTPHWFRHRLATALAHDPRGAMEQGGWQDYRSFIGYTHDVPQRRRALVAAMDAPGVPPTAAPAPAHVANQGIRPLRLAAMPGGPRR